MLGFTLECFYDLGWWEYDCLIEGYNQKIKLQWQQTLYHIYSDIMGNPAIPSYQKPWSFQEFYEEAIEGKKHDFVISMEEFERVQNIWGIK